MTSIVLSQKPGITYATHMSVEEKKSLLLSPHIFTGMAANGGGDYTNEEHRWKKQIGPKEQKQYPSWV